MTKKKDKPRNEIVPVAVTAEDKELLRKEAVARKTSVSNIVYEMMERGNLRRLRARNVESSATK